jgi:REP element-mobilizing transposase RayT
MFRRPPRLPEFSYIGPYAYFFTACTHQRAPVFEDGDFAAYASDQLLRHAIARGFALSAYCLMPDHVHVLAEGRTDHADGRRFFEGWRQKTGFDWRRKHASKLWQEGYWDWILREGEDPLRVAAYIVQNPVRAGLVRSPADYRWIGSSEYTVSQMVTAIQLEPGRRRRG